MRYFAASPCERLIVEKPKQQREASPPALPKDHPCFGCSYHGTCSTGTCYRDLIVTTKDRRTRK